MSSEPVTWEREDHTAAKHDLLRRFFNKWVSIHSETFKKTSGGLVRIYDGFAGPGVYSGGEPGSPAILTRALCEHPRLMTHWTGVDYEFHFVEMDSRRAMSLEERLKALQAEMRAQGKWSERISWAVTCGRYEDNVPQPVARRDSTLFLFLDPFGYSNSPMTLTLDVVQQPKADTLIFLPLSFVNRFVGREGQEVALDRLFGTSEWRELPEGPGRPQRLLELFQRQVRKGGLTYTLPFRLRPADGSNEYWIVGASAHPKGFATIKEAYWAVDPIDGQGFEAPRGEIPGQEALFELQSPGSPNTQALLAHLRSTFDRSWFTVEDAIALTERSRFLDSHLKKTTLAPAERGGLLEVERPAGARQFKEGKGIRLRFK
jgi:three-Cys-motif partner protein